MAHAMRLVRYAQLPKVGTRRRLGSAILSSGSASPYIAFTHREVEPESPQRGAFVQGEQPYDDNVHLDWNTLLR